MTDRRGSKRLKLFKRVMATSLVPEQSSHTFTGSVYITDISYHGCQLFTPLSFPPSTMLKLFMPQSRIRNVEANVIWSNIVSSESSVPRWKVGLELVMPGNHWDIHPAPQDWERAKEPQAFLQQEEPQEPN